MSTKARREAAQPVSHAVVSSPFASEDSKIMKLLTPLCLLVLYLMISACQSAQPSNATTAPTSSSAGRAAATVSTTRSATHMAETVPATSSATATPSTSPAIGPGLTEGMAYADFHAALVKQGWKPVVDKQCMANVVGGNYKTLCAARSSAMCKACKQMPELSSCGAGGVCLMRFHHPGNNKNLDVGTFGDISDWNVHGAHSQIFVTGWSTPPARPH